MFVLYDKMQIYFASMLSRFNNFTFKFFPPPSSIFCIRLYGCDFVRGKPKNIHGNYLSCQIVETSSRNDQTNGISRERNSNKTNTHTLKS